MHLPPRSLTDLGEGRRAVDRRAERGDSLARIETELIGCAHLDEERRAALWLYAWHRLEAGPRRSLAFQLALG